MAEPKEGRTSVPEEISKLLSHQSWRPLYLRISCSVIWWSYWLSSVRALRYWQSNTQFNLYCWYTSWSSLACATSKSHSCLARCGLPQSSSWHQPLTNLLTRKGFGLVFFFYVPNVMGLWCKTKDSTTAQGPVCYQVMKKWCGTCRRWWTTGGLGHLLCNMTLHCRWGTHWK